MCEEKEGIHITSFEVYFFDGDRNVPRRMLSTVVTLDGEYTEADEDEFMKEFKPILAERVAILEKDVVISRYKFL